MFEYENKNSYGIKNENDMTNNMTCIHNDEVKNIAECNVLHDIINPPKQAKKLNSHYSPILHAFMNTRKSKAKLKTFASYWIVDIVTGF